MLRRIAMLLAVAAVLAPAAGRANEWEEDYSDDWRSEPPPRSDDYPVSVDVDAAVSIDTFQGALAPYGEWVVAGSYGRVWRPHVAAGWRPYYYGRWEWTNEGWLWVSDEPWGWAAYHYGRWAQDPYNGWVWVPGYQWAPAWVSWRYSGDVVGWAPLGPGVSVYVSTTPYAEAWWTFVPCDHFVAVPVYQVAYQPVYTRRYFYATAPAPARPGWRAEAGRAVAPPAWGGPPPRTIEQRIGRPVTPVRVVPAPSPGASRVGPGEVAIYRPGARGLGASPRPAPAARPGNRGDEGRPGQAFHGSDPRAAKEPARGDSARMEQRGRASRDQATAPAPQPAQPRQPQFRRSEGGAGGAPQAAPAPRGAPAPRTAAAPRGERREERRRD
jgi:hypothetical protein